MISWRDLAACQGMDTSLFYNTENIGGPREGKGVSGEKEKEIRAKKICGECPVREDCLDYAVDYSLGYGIWAGMTPGERECWKRKHA